MVNGWRNVTVMTMAALALCGCRSIHRFTQACNRDTDRYQQATTVPRIKVPAGIDAPDTRSALQIPVLNEPAAPPAGPKDPCLDAPPKFTEPKGPRPPPAA